MRIGVPTTSYPRFEGDAAGVFVRELCRALVGRGHTCEVIAPDDEAVGPLADPGIEIVRASHRAPGWPRTFYGAGAPDNIARDRRALLGALGFATGLVRLVRARAPRWDAVISHWALPSAAATYLSRVAARHVAVWHSADVHLAHAHLGRAAWPLLRPMADAHVFVAGHLRDRLGAGHDPRATVIPMGVPWPAVAVDRAPLAARSLRVLVLARLVPIKRVALAIEACAAAGDVELVVAGDGPERESLERGVTRRGLRVRFVGAVGEREKRDLFAWADVFLATSGRAPTGATEGYPVAPREALAHGVMVLATENEAHRELAARCGPAVLLAPEETLAAQLRALAADPQRVQALSRSARSAVADDDWPRVAQRFERLLTARRAARPGAQAPRAPTDPVAQGS